MSRTVYLAVAGLIASCCTATVAFAQSSRSEQATVGFPFVAGDTMLPAGTYRVSIDPFDPTVLLIRNRDGRPMAWIDTVGVTDRGNRPMTTGAELVFDQVGNQYFLRQAWIDGEAHDVRRGTLEARAERQMTASHSRASAEAATQPVG